MWAYEHQLQALLLKYPTKFNCAVTVQTSPLTVDMHKIIVTCPGYLHVQDRFDLEDEAECESEAYARSNPPKQNRVGS